MKQIRVRLASYDWLVLNSSGGRDSQTMLRQVSLRCDMEGVPRERLVVVHCELEEEWPGTKELAEEQARHYGLRFEVVQREKGNLLDAVLARRDFLDSKGRYDTPAWMSPAQRYCTSYFKRDPVKKLFTRLAAETRATQGKRYRVRILNCLGIRAAESCSRSKMLPFRLNDANGVRVIHTWLPLFGWSDADVWEDIHACGVPFHPAYSLGMPRLSCCLCVMAPREALHLAGLHNPDLLRKYVAVEKTVRSTFRKNLALADVLAEVEAGILPGPIKTWEA